MRCFIFFNSPTSFLILLDTKQFSKIRKLFLRLSDETAYDDLEITTLDDVLYMKMKNDISILLDDHLSLYEHQSTFNPNMPLRGLLYFADLYRQLFGSRHLYSTKLLHLPTPVYIVFYNGKQEIGEEKILKLSDSFSNSNGHPKLELETRILNINHGHNQKLFEHCRTLREYSIFVDKIKPITRR